jgi:soluble cytochrome b562
MSEKVTTAHILSHLRKLYDGHALLKETLGAMKSRLQAIEKQIEEQARENIQDAEHALSLSQGFTNLQEEINCLRKAIEIIESNDSPPSRLN